MKWQALMAAAVLGAGITACDKVPFFGKKEEAKTPTPIAGEVVPDSAAVAAAVDTTVAPPPPPPEPTPAGSMASADEEPWTPVQTGTVNPGMTQEEVVATWGAPVVERQNQDWTYLYFRNGCEKSCGTFDVVMLQGGRVVDAIVRGDGHLYSGESSSPPGRAPTPTNVAPLVTGASGAEE